MMKLNVLPARAGAQWVKLGLRTFFRQPLALGALFVLFLIIISLAALIPLAGIVISPTLVPALTVGLMAATHEAENGKTPLPTVLFAAFRRDAARTRAMIGLGLMFAAASLVVIGISMSIDGGRFLSLISAPPEHLNTLTLNPRLLLAMLVTLALYLPVSIAFWHAPALVYWHGVAPVKSLFFSFVAVLKNTRSFLLYGLLWMGLSLGVSMTLAILALSAGNLALVTLVSLPVSLLLGALFFTSVWFTFRDSFTADTPPPDDLPPESQSAP